MECITTQPATARHTLHAPADDGPPATRRRLVWRCIAWAPAVLVAGAYLAFALWHLPEHRYQINPDGVGYISVAQKYARGEFADAINAYWSPLYSWLLVPLLLAGIEPLLATKLLGVAIGGATLAALWLLLRRAAVQVDVRMLACAAAIPLVVDAAYVVTTPDLLLGAALLLYLATMCGNDRNRPWRSSAIIGVSAALAFLAKAYALPVVVAHFLLVRGVDMLRAQGGAERRAVALRSALALGVFATAIAPWAAALSLKHGHFTLGSTGRHNLRIDAPQSRGQVMHFAGFLPPPNATAISAWEDITPHIDLLPAWRPWASEENRQFLWQQIRRNYIDLMRLLERHTAWLYPLLLVALLLPLARADRRPQRPALLLALALLIYPLGYLVLHVERRFLLPMVLLLLAMGAYAIARAGARGLLSGWPRRSLAILALGSTFIWLPIQSLHDTRHDGARYAEWASALRGTLPSGAAIASDGQWSASLYLAFHLDLRYFGEPAPRQTHAAIQADLERLGVDYFILWKRHIDWPSRAGWVQIAPKADLPLRIYRRPAVIEQEDEATR